MAVISAKEFKAKATREIEIPGFDIDETFTIKIRPMSLLGMIRKGKIDNELLASVLDLFKSNTKKINTKKGTIADGLEMDVLQKPEMLQNLDDLMRKVAQEVMIAPTYEEVADYLTDGQLQAIFEEAQGKIQQVKPTV